VIAVDTNILVYAHREESPQHDRALRALRDLAEGADTWALPVFVLGEFLRVVTHHRIFAPPSSRDRALQALDALIASPTVRVLHPGERFWSLLRAALDEASGTGNLVLDAEIVAVCREHGVTTVLSEDRDFRRFPSVRLRTLDPA
jgi:toxin-antitoxin system PIN domain toxin